MFCVRHLSCFTKVVFIVSDQLIKVLLRIMFVDTPLLGPSGGKHIEEVRKLVSLFHFTNTFGEESLLTLD